MSLLLTGIGVSQGIAIGKAHMLKRGNPEILKISIPSHRIENEIRRFREALRLACDQLHNLRHIIPTDAPSDAFEFIEAHLLMLSDGMLCEVPETLIRHRQCNAEWALKLQRDELVAVFDQMQDPYIRTRRNDIDHVIHRVQRILLNRDPKLPQGPNISNHIIIADDLTPVDTLLLQHQGIAGFITECGGPLSHTAILARGLAIPAVVGIHDALNMLHNGEIIILDGDKGMVIADSDEKTLKTYRQHQRDRRNYLKHLTSLRDTRTETLDGHPIHLKANIEVKQDIRTIKLVAAEGVGLYRTEFMFMDRNQPADEEEQLQNYRSVIRALKSKPLTIRTLDLGADKECTNSHSNTTPATNPALGLRAIRRSLKDIDMFKVQLRAILRASAYGPVRIMFPMLTCLKELLQIMRLLDETKQELRSQKRRFAEHIPIGAMIEVPAAALTADAFAKHVDFLSIGTNDLIQYTLAIDRVDGEVNYLYDPLHPAVLKLIDMTLKAGRRAKIEVSMCGEMAGDVRYTRLLLGMGLREFSTPPSTLLEVKKAIIATNISNLKTQCKRILDSHDPEKISTLVSELNQ